MEKEKWKYRIENIYFRFKLVFVLLIIILIFNSLLLGIASLVSKFFGNETGFEVIKIE